MTELQFRDERFSYPWTQFNTTDLTTVLPMKFCSNRGPWVAWSRGTRLQQNLVKYLST